MQVIFEKDQHHPLWFRETDHLLGSLTVIKPPGLGGHTAAIQQHCGRYQDTRVGGCIFRLWNDY